MSKQLLVVFGATGQQGGSVIDQVLKNTKLSETFALRGLSRDPSSAPSQALATKGVEVVKGDPNSDSDMKAALKGAHTVFLMTNSVATPTGGAEETELGNHLADLVVESGAKYLIWSSMISPARLSNGKFTHVSVFESKYDVEQYIRKLPIKSSFFIPASFMQNYQGQLKPRPMGDGTYALFNIFAPDAKVPLIDIAGDTGKWIASILLEPEKYAGKGIACATALYSQKEVVEAMSKATGKTIKHIQIPLEQFESYLPPERKAIYSDMTQFIGETGYYGADMEKEVKWGAEQAQGPLTTLEEYFRRDPLKLD